MKLTKRTKEVLSQFSLMDGYIKFKKGKKQALINTHKTVLVEAELDQEIPKEFGPIPIKDFVRLLEIFDDPEVAFKSEQIVVKEGEAELLVNSIELTDFPIGKEVNFPPNGIVLNLSKPVVEKIKKLKRTMGKNVLEIVGDGSAVYLRTVSRWIPIFDHEMVTKIGETDRVFSLSLRLSELNLVADSYTVHLSNRSIVKMCSESSKLTYYVALENMDYFDQKVCQ